MVYSNSSKGSRMLTKEEFLALLPGEEFVSEGLRAFKMADDAFAFLEGGRGIVWSQPADI